MKKNRSTKKLIEYIQTLPKHIQKTIAERIIEPTTKKKKDKKVL